MRLFYCGSYIYVAAAVDKPHQTRDSFSPLSTSVPHLLRRLWGRRRSAAAWVILNGPRNSTKERRKVFDKRGKIKERQIKEVMLGIDQSKITTKKHWTKSRQDWLKFFFHGTFHNMFRLNTRCTYDCIGTSGKNCQNPHEGVLWMIFKFKIPFEYSCNSY